MNKKLPQLLIKAKNLSEQPGVYLMKNFKNQVIYVGKAKNLPKRVKTYFQVKYPKSLKTTKMVQEVKDFDCLVVGNETEALLLEFNLIKKYQPKYNIKLKNTQGYPFLELNLNDPYPRLIVTYRPQKKTKVLHFGPYPNIGQLYEVKELLNKNLKLRTCTDAEFANRVRPCLLYQINQCSGPCVFKDQGYPKQIMQLQGILNGDPKVLKELKAQMKHLAQSQEFEEAAKIRDLISFCHKQKSVVHQVKKDNLVYIAFQEYQNSILVGLLHIQSGQVNKLDKLILENFEQEDPEVFLNNSLITLLQGVETPQVKTSFKINESIKALVKQICNLDIQQQEDKQYNKLIYDNLTWDEKLSVEQLEKIQSELLLQNVPYKIECMDISNWQESSPVGSKVVMIEGILDKTEYRKYKMKTPGPNDFAMIKELVTRRFQKSDQSFPDLLVIDGGEQQLKKAWEALQELKVQGVEVVGLAKDKTLSSFTSSEVLRKGERIVKLDGTVVELKSSMQSYILTKLRDEAHRFAIKYHRQLRSKNSLMTFNKSKKEDK